MGSTKLQVEVRKEGDNDAVARVDGIAIVIVGGNDDVDIEDGFVIDVE